MNLFALLLIPFLSGLLLLFFRQTKTVRIIALSSAVGNLLLTAAIALNPETTGYSVNWIDFLGIRFSVGCDGISLIMIILTNFLFPFIILAGFNREQSRIPMLNFLILLTQSALNGVFIAQNAVLFYVFWELVLIPVYFILLLWGGEGRKTITLKFFIYTLTGSLFLLLGIIFLYLQTPGNHSTEFSAFRQLDIPDKTQFWLFWVLFIAFAIKMPVFPFHTWQPSTYNMASTQGVMILAGALTKMGIYGALRFLFPVVPQGVLYWQNTVIILCIIGLIYASVIAFRINNLKMLIAYSSMAHISLMAAALFVLNVYALHGLVFQVLGHGITIVALFYLTGLIKEKTGTLELPQMGGLKLKLPRMSVLFLIVILGSIALPLTIGFAGEFLMITGLFKQSVWYALTGGTTLVLGAIYMLYAYQRVMLGEPKPVFDKVNDIGTLDYLILIPLIMIIIGLGIYPQPIVNLINQPAETIQNLIGPAGDVISWITR
jgi:NADH-quinone oxidoreductase subunit M